MYSVGFEIARRGAAAAAAGLAGAAVPPAATAREVLSRALLQPPIVAIVVGCAVGLTPLAGLFFGPGAPLGGLGDVATLLGGGSVPSANLVLAGSLFGGAADALRDARAWLGDAPPPPAGRGAAADLADAARVFARAASRAWAERGGRRAALVDADAGGDAGGGANGGAGGGAGAASAEAGAGGDAREAAAAASAAADSGAGAAPAVFAFVAAGAGAGAPPPSRLGLSTMATIIALRLVVCPALCLSLFWAAQVARVPLLASDDPVLTLVVCVQAAMPTAQTLLVVLSNVGDERGGKALSLLFIVQYPLACIALVPWLMVALELAGVR